MKSSCYYVTNNRVASSTLKYLDLAILVMNKHAHFFFLFQHSCFSQKNIFYLSCFGISKGTSQNFQTTPRGTYDMVVLFSSGFHTMKQLILQRFEITLNYFVIVQGNRLFFYLLQTVGNLECGLWGQFASHTSQLQEILQNSLAN